MRSDVEHIGLLQDLSQQDITSMAIKHSKQVIIIFRKVVKMYAGILHKLSPSLIIWVITFHMTDSIGDVLIIIYSFAFRKVILKAEKTVFIPHLK